MAKITFANTGKTYECATGKSFMEFCDESGAPHDFGCTVGSCGTCVCVVEPAGNVSPATKDEKDTVEMCTSTPGARLGCQFKVLGDIVVRPA
ncbi:MAG: hypothetical protein RL112_2398 [Planctomycetota bacterium]|jgi:ferredoxin